MEEAFEARVATLEQMFCQTFAEFCPTLAEEFAKVRREPEKMSPSFVSEETVSVYRLAVKKVEMKSFDSEDSVGLITQAEMYFEVQGTPEEVKVKLAKLSMEDTMIHWFNMLRETEDELTWLKTETCLD